MFQRLKKKQVKKDWIKDKFGWCVWVCVLHHKINVWKVSRNVKKYQILPHSPRSVSFHLADTEISRSPQA